MAQALETNAQPADSDQYLTFMQSGDMYAIPLLGVKEIIEYGGITPIPTLPDFIRGVINLRGRVVPVIDLGSRFSKTEREITRRTCIIIVEVGSGEDNHDMGVIVDSVSAVIDIPIANIQPPPAFGAKIRVDFIQGMWKSDDRFFIVMDIDQVLSVDEITHLAEVLQESVA
ncbi:chemotaxis protein CheW [Hahella sp. KA22]|uniref:chemotaxis protein CheW n=1 Tax=Hahella sp. KA22 TaxID=1628392 RepID=UPI000FDEA0B5|nr:chemotaxis protein CheW [Hahella sp. KA22]AZZ92207.1 chemotaxis protein CheW [Hahella sp. KA22]QAY55578.1 chemotaxis protein CheW [Hahella sp. KA22]